MIIQSAFKPAWWLSNPHAQTVYPTFAQRLPAPVNRVERFELPDGDFLDLAWATGDLPANSPLVILLHGLGGGIQSAYVSRLLTAFNQCGWRGVLMHFRGAGNQLNRQPRAYHSGDTSDLDCFMNELHKREPNNKKAMVGISLGGNILLKWLAEKGVNTPIETSVAVSVPFQLRLAANRLNSGLSRIYQMYLLKEMREVFLRKLAAYGDRMPPSVQQLNTIRCFWTFDEFITAPLNGFANVHAYYREASSRRYIPNIKIPTLIIHSEDDPFMTPDVIPTADELPANVTLELSKKGGHVGFISGNVPGKPIYWLDERIPNHLQKFLTE